MSYAKAKIFTKMDSGAVQVYRRCKYENKGNNLR